MTTSIAPRGSDERDAHLANRAALLTIACLSSFLLAVLTIPAAFQRTDAAVPRILASSPLAVGVGAGLMARAARARLRALRDERASTHEDGPADVESQPRAEPSRRTTPRRNDMGG